MRDIIHVLQFPYNSKPPRNHSAIPKIDPVEYSIDISGLVNNLRMLTLAHLHNETLFSCQSSIITLQCSGSHYIEQIY